MKHFIITIAFLLLPLLAFGHEPLNVSKDDPRVIYVNNEIPAEILRAYNDQVELVTELRLKIQELEQELFFTTERLTNLERQVWDMPANHSLKGTQ